MTMNSQSPATQEPSTAYEGHLDTFGPDFITGWAFDARSPGRRVAVEVLGDGVPLAQGLAEHRRADLVAAGKGDGGCAFKLPVPLALCDGQPHNIAVRIVGQPQPLPARVLQFVAQSPGGGDAARLEAGALVGSFTRADVDSEILLLDVRDLETGAYAAQGKGQRDPQNPGLVDFRIALPGSLFDGRPHAFGVYLHGEAGPVACASMVMPYVPAPEQAALRYARQGLSPGLGSVAAHRYEALTRSLEDALAAIPATEFQQRVRQLVNAHAWLSKGPQAEAQDYGSLVFPVQERPRVSVIVAACNQFHLTYHCLASLLLAPNATPFEVILVDDGSVDQTQEVERWVTGITRVRNEESQGFVHACNRGAEAARGDYLVLLNNDTEVTARWLDELLWPFENFEGVGLAGAKLLYPDGRLQEAGGIVWSSGNPANYGRGGNAHEPRFSYTRQADYLSGACLMVPAALWRELGGFDRSYAPAYFEDTDLAFRVRAHGYKTVYAALSRVFHAEGGSNGTDVAAGVKRYQETNRPKFKSRWLDACAGNGREGADPDWVKDRGVQLRALVVDMRTPMPDRDAGSYAAMQEMRLLQSLGFKCTFLPQNLAWMGHYTEALQRMGVECLHAPFITSFDQLLDQRGREFDLVYITRYHVARQYVSRLRQTAPQAKLVLMNADLHFLRELRRALVTGRGRDMQAARQTRKDELAVMSQVDLVLTYTAVEEAVIQSHNLDSTRVSRCPWVAETSDTVPPYGRRSGIAFLGGFGHPPNEEAVEWFLVNVWPRLSAELPDGRLHIYGGDVPPRLAALVARHPGVSLEGWVADVAQAYDRCRVFVAPLQSGAGIKGKVIGALSHGVPCVVSPVAAEGIPVADGVDAAIAGDPEAWARAIVGLHQNESAWNAMSQRALQFARAHYGFQRGITVMQDSLRKAGIDSHPASRVLVAHDQRRGSLSQS